MKAIIARHPPAHDRMRLLTRRVGASNWEQGPGMHSVRGAANADAGVLALFDDLPLVSFSLAVVAVPLSRGRERRLGPHSAKLFVTAARAMTLDVVAAAQLLGGVRSADQAPASMTPRRI